MKIDWQHFNEVVESGDAESIAYERERVKVMLQETIMDMLDQGYTMHRIIYGAIASVELALRQEKALTPSLKFKQEYSYHIAEQYKMEVYKDPKRIQPGDLVGVLSYDKKGKISNLNTVMALSKSGRSWIVEGFNNPHGSGERWKTTISAKNMLLGVHATVNPIYDKEKIFFFYN